MRVSEEIKALKLAGAYRDVEHQDEVENGMPKEQYEAGRLCQLEPRYPKLRKTHYEYEVDDVPFEEEPDRVGLVLHQADPFVELPSHEGYVEPEGIEALCRRIEDCERYDWVARGLISSSLILGG